VLLSWTLEATAAPTHSCAGYPSREDALGCDVQTLGRGGVTSHNPVVAESSDSDQTVTLLGLR
jgi:hypothetical protein